MKNVRRIRMFVMAVMAIAFAACTVDTDEYMSSEAPAMEQTPLFFPLENVGEIEMDSESTRSFLEANANSWNFKWENGDVINYIVRRNNSTVATGQGSILNTSSGTQLKITPTTTMRSGDVLYTYYNGAAANATSVSSTPMVIPSLQLCAWGNESFTDTQTTTTTTTDTQEYALTLSNITLGTTSVSNQTTTTPPSCVVSFKVSNYSGSYAYKWSTDKQTWNVLTVGSDGRASVTRYFSGSMSFSGSSNTANKTSNIYVRCEDGTAAKLPINITCTKSKSKSSVWGGWSSGWMSGATVYNYTYAAGTPTAGSFTVTTTSTSSTTTTETTEGPTRLMPLRNCMPLVGNAVTLTSSMISGNKIGNSINMGMKGSLLELRISSKDASIGVGEVIESVTFNANKAIAGNCTCNLSTGKFSGLDSYSITSSVEGLGYVIPTYESGDYATVTMVVAPGSYTGSYVVKTNVATYTYTFTSSKTFTVNKRLATNVNLASSSIVRTLNAAPEPIIYDVTFQAGEGTTINGEATATEGESYTATISLDEDYEDLDVTVTMDGQPIDDVYADGVVTIPAVTGDIVITTTAEEVADLPDIEGGEDVPGDEPGIDEPGDEPGIDEPGDEPGDEPAITTPDPVYAVFCSDRHTYSSSYGATANPQALFANAVSTVPYTVSYVGLVGDVVGDGNSSTSTANITTSALQNEVRATSSYFANSKVQVMWGKHDSGVSDDIDILFGETAGSSTHCWTQYDSQGNVAFYVYAIAYDDMSSATNASSAATNFKNWVSTLTDNAPIIVCSHMPMHKEKNDNYGGSTWAKALNVAATGSENGTTITRNVVFFHGHNHAHTLPASSTERYNTPGTTINMQGKSSGENVTIRYTYITAGYLLEGSYATLMEVSDEALTFTKYHAGTPSLLGSISRIE